MITTSLDTPQPIVLGTAGHVDHGKSTLVHALTGIDPDRLAEEKARSMTIDLGFAWLTLPNGRTASIIDVPGHERFIKNMLAGAGGIDAALLVIAADEGPMPQTREHLAILDLLGIDRGVIVLAKSDLVDADWLDLMTAETHELIAGTLLSDAAIVTVSARTGAGLDTLTAEIDRLADRRSTGAGDHRPRLPIDRVFTVAGFGTVVTGTLSGGELAVGQELRLVPTGLPVRVRGLQTHREQVAQAIPGSRVAVNLAGVTVDQIRRGDVLASPALLTPSVRLDARVRLLNTASTRLDQNDEVDFFTGAAVLLARATPLDREALAPGDEGWVQFRFARPIAALRGDRFIIRRPSPSETIGGGEIVDPDPARHRRFRPEVLWALELLAAGTAADIVFAAIAERPRSMRVLVADPAAGLSADQVERAVTELAENGSVVLLPGQRIGETAGYVLSAAHWRAFLERMALDLAEFHRAYPLRRGVPREALRHNLGLDPPLFDAAVAAAAIADVLVDEQGTIRLPSFQIALNASQEAAVAPFLAAVASQPFSPPAPATFGLDGELVV
ncbi:MAG: selenocysteine-specific translation elongation factor, partial [Chloroflexota bacterium]|nr:selenocysteine-specific translation elongation factor [Chloroflexota bacterium]